MLRYRYLVFLVVFLAIFSSGFARENQSNIKLILNPVIRSEEIIEIDSFSSQIYARKIGKSREIEFLSRSSILDTLRNHESGTGFYHSYCSTYFATRLTIPNNVASICSILRIRYRVFYPNATNNAPCSLFLWRDTIINGIHQPGSVIWSGLHNLQYHQAATVWWSIIFNFPNILNRNEHFWIGAINFNESFYFTSDASANPDTTRNLRRNWGYDWQTYENDFSFEAVVRYEPMDNNVGATSIQGVERIMLGNTITAVEATVKNFGNITLGAGIPVIMNITGPSFFLADTEYTTSTLTQNATELITFSEDWQVPTITGDYEVKVWTAFDLDSIYNNDTCTYRVFVYNTGIRESFVNYDFPPAGWLVFDFNNDNYWRRDSFASGFYTPPAGAVITYDEPPYNPNNDWLVSPRFHAEPTDSIIFFYRAASSSRMETLLVRMNFNSLSNDTSNFQIVQTIATNNFNWQKSIISLNSYLSQPDTISIAFHYPCNYKFYVAIDDIITPQPIRSIDVFTQNIEAPLLPIIMDSTYIPSAKFRNNSIDNSSEFLLVNVYYEISGESTNYYDSLMNEPIEHGNSEPFSFAPFTPVVSETVEIKVWVYYEDDENHTNDTITKIVFIAPKFHEIPYTADFNEIWGRYGDNPPLGGWRIIDNGNERNPTWNTNDWHKDTVTSGSILRTVAKVSYSPVENQQEWLISPRLNCSIPGTYTLSYWHWYRDYSQLTPDSGVVLISNNGGISWHRIVKYSNTTNSGNRFHDISLRASGHNDVRIAFLYGARDEWWWCIDDFSVTWIMSTPQLVYPTNGMETLATAIDMSWQEVTGATQYIVQIAYDSTFLFPIISETVSNPAYRCSLPPYRYFWKVKAGQPYGNWSDIWHFTIIEPPPPVYGWQQLDSIIVPIGGKNVKDGGALTFCPVDSCIYAFKGNNTREFYSYNINQAKWSVRRQIDIDSVRDRKVKKGSALCAGDTLIYAVKGNTDEFWAYNIYSDTWIRLSSVPGKKLKGGTGLVYVRQTKNFEKNRDSNKLSATTGNSEKLLPFNEMIYLLKGGSKEREFYAYSVDFDTWIKKMDVPLEKHNKIFKDGSAIVYDGDSRIYALKGGSKVNEFYYYDISADTWAVLANDTIPLKHPNFTKKKKVKNGGGLAIIGSTIYAIKGGGCIEFWQYDINNQTWIGIDTIPWLHKKSVPKNGAALTASFNEVFLLKGNNTHEFWSIFPTPAKESKVLRISDRQPVTNTNLNIDKISEISATNLFVNPNPCSDNATFFYSIAQPGMISVKINDAAGRRVKTIYQGYMNDGNHNMNMFVGDIPNGVYFITLETEQNLSKTKLIIK